MGNPSITALVTAFARGYHAAHGHPPIFDDRLAFQILTPEEQAFLSQSVAGMLAFVNPELAAAGLDQAVALDWVMEVQTAPIAVSRARYVEDCLESAAERGAEQYVILGAGFETFAFRRPDLMERLEVFEVDHPSTQDFKRKRLAALGWSVPSRLHFVSVDFSCDDLAGALRRESYDPGKCSCFSWPGVTYYLEKNAVLNTLRVVAALMAEGSSVVFDYLEGDAFDPAKASARMQRMQAIVAHTGEPMKSAFEDLELRYELGRIGLKVDELLDSAEIERRYFSGRDDGYHAFEHVHFVRAGTVSESSEPDTE